ncbi:unnamed protein product [Adineta ricciae]|uniref:Uncharacterized protein n=1 Tax=Adineta ricciae TaxID=249248 RepID=A0A813X462_ADIRI|nr:unnamed protein product [Adineta ricciae]
MGFFDLHEPEDGQDRFFLYAMIILPVCAATSYLFDAWYHYTHSDEERNYQGLLSTIVIVFSYLQYCAPIRSRKALTIYFLSVCLITEAATIGYLLYYIKKKDITNIIFHVSSLLLEILFTSALIYCRVVREYESHIVVENKHLFHFMSRLEVILTIFIPVYVNVKYTSLTRNMIAYFLLFDFFSDSYSRFQGVWIKSALYLFATTTTVAVATEWVYFNHHEHIYEQVSIVAELVSEGLCDLIIILQFFPFHFKTQHVNNIARQALLIHRNLHASIANPSIPNGDANETSQNGEIKGIAELVNTSSSNETELNTSM